MLKFEKPEIRIFDTTIFDEPSEYEKAYRFVDSSRREKVDSFKLKKDKYLSLISFNPKFCKIFTSYIKTFLPYILAFFH